MSDDQIAKNLLSGKGCNTCKVNKQDRHCFTWWGEAIGWQWERMHESGTCDQWALNEIDVAFIR